MEEKSEFANRPSEWNFIKDLSNDPSNQEIYDGYKKWLEDEIQKAKESEDFHAASLWDKQQKLGFLKAQDEEDYEKMQRIASQCNPNWLAIVSRPSVTNCGRPNPEEDEKLEQWWKWAGNHHREKSATEWKENHPSFKMDFVCPKKWNEMQSTENRKVRFCDDCQKNVYFCDNIVEARELGGQGCCIGIAVGIKRKEEDLVGELSIFGRPSHEHIEENKQREIPDRISAKRIMKKTELSMKGKDTPYPAEWLHDYGD